MKCIRIDSRQEHKEITSSAMHFCISVAVNKVALMHNNKKGVELTNGTLAAWQQKMGKWEWWGKDEWGREEGVCAEGGEQHWAQASHSLCVLSQSRGHSLPTDTPCCLDQHSCCSSSITESGLRGHRSGECYFCLLLFCFHLKETAKSAARKVAFYCKHSNICGTFPPGRGRFTLHKGWDGV